MGNVTKKQQTKSAEVAEKIAAIAKVAKTDEFECQMKDYTAQLKVEIYGVINANVDMGVKWKEEWRVAIEEMINQIQVSSNSFGPFVKFNNVPGLMLQPFFNLSSGWFFPAEFTNSSDPFNSLVGYDGCGNSTISSIQMKVRRCLNMDKLPYNLWCEIFQQFYYSLGNSAHTTYTNGDPHPGIKLLSPPVQRQLYLENQHCVLPQHYASTIFCDVPCDRGWISLSSVRDTFGYNRTNPAVWNCKTKFRTRIRLHIVSIQCSNLLQLLFRHDRQKLSSAEQLLSTISWTVGLTSTTVVARMETIDPGSYLAITKTGWSVESNLAIAKLLPPFTLNPTGTAEIFKVAHARERFLLEQFDSYELTTIFHAMAKINIEYAYLLQEKLCWRFPMIDDCYDDPKNLRGSVTTAPVHKEMEYFYNLISSVRELIGGSNNVCRLPTALAKLVTDYFEFPLPSIDCQSAEWKVENSPLDVW